MLKMALEMYVHLKGLINLLKEDPFKVGVAEKIKKLIGIKNLDLRHYLINI